MRPSSKSRSKAGPARHIAGLSPSEQFEISGFPLQREGQPGRRYSVWFSTPNPPGSINWMSGSSSAIRRVLARDSSSAISDRGYRCSAGAETPLSVAPLPSRSTCQRGHGRTTSYTVARNYRISFRFWRKLNVVVCSTLRARYSFAPVEFTMLRCLEENNALFQIFRWLYNALCLACILTI